MTATATEERVYDEKPCGQHQTVPFAGELPSRMIISPQWRRAIDEYLVAQRAAGHRKTMINTLRQRLEQMARRIGAEPWDLAAEELVSWAGSQEWEQETRRGRYNAYRSFWGWAVKTGRCTVDVSLELAKVRMAQPNPQPIPTRLYQKALMKADPDEQLWLALAHDHGLRRCEVATVHSDDVFEDLVGHSLLVHGKGGKRRQVPLTPSMARKLRDRPQGWAFPGDDEGHLSARWIGRRVAQLLDGQWTMHKLRHAAGTAFYLHGDLAIAQKLLGHASPATTLIYVKLPDERLRATVLAASSAA